MIEEAGYSSREQNARQGRKIVSDCCPRKVAQRSNGNRSILEAVLVWVVAEGWLTFGG